MRGRPKSISVYTDGIVNRLGLGASFYGPVVLRGVSTMIGIVKLRGLFALLAGLTVAVFSFGAEPLTKVSLQLPYLHQFQFAGLYAAQTKGFFQEEGLEVEVRSTSNERRNSRTEVLEGRAEFGIAQGPQLVTARLEGNDFI